MLVCVCLLGGSWSVRAEPEKLRKYRDTIGISVRLNPKGYVNKTDYK
jgi:hypothetical protein